MIRVKIDGIEKLNRAAQILQKNSNNMAKSLEQAGENYGNSVVARSVLAYLSGPRPEKLGVVTGRLRASIRSRIVPGKREVRVYLGTDVPYARIHEIGGMAGRQNRVRIRARPFLRPAMEDQFPGLVKAVELILRKVGTDRV